MKRLLLTWIAVLLTFVDTVYAGQFTMHVGPPAVGTGGANPVSVPPTSAAEWEFQYVTDKEYEWNLAASPGLLYGGRSRVANGLYVSFGGGLVIDANGSGPGAYSSFGYEAGSALKFNIELKQALGFDYGNNHILSPYALRVGVSF